MLCGEILGEQLVPWSESICYPVLCVILKKILYTNLEFSGPLLTDNKSYNYIKK